MTRGLLSLVVLLMTTGVGRPDTVVVIGAVVISSTNNRQSDVLVGLNCNKAGSDCDGPRDTTRKTGIYSFVRENVSGVATFYVTYEGQGYHAEPVIIPLNTGRKDGNTLKLVADRDLELLAEHASYSPDQARRHVAAILNTAAVKKLSANPENARKITSAASKDVATVAALTRNAQGKLLNLDALYNSVRPHLDMSLDAHMLIKKEDFLKLDQLPEFEEMKQSPPKLDPSVLLRDPAKLPAEKFRQIVTLSDYEIETDWVANSNHYELVRSYLKAHASDKKHFHFIVLDRQLKATKSRAIAVDGDLTDEMIGRMFQEDPSARAWAWYNGLLKGNKLTIEQRRDITSRAQEFSPIVVDVPK